VGLVRSMGGRAGSRRRAALQPPRHRHASAQCARVRRRAHVRWWFADSSAKSTTKQARARAPMCSADAGSAGRGRGLAALPRPSQCGPAEDELNWLKIGTRRAARRRCPAHALWCCAQGRGAAACDARLVRYARGVQSAQQGAARASRFSERQTRANFPPDFFLKKN